MNEDNEKKDKEYKLVIGKVPTLTKRNVFFILLAFFLLALLYLIPTPEGLSNNGKIMIVFYLWEVFCGLLNQFH